MNINALLRAATVALLWSAFGLQAAWAGHPCEEFNPTPNIVYKGLTLAKQSYDALEDSGAKVAIIARVGQDLSQYRLRYSHLGYVLRDHPDGRWTVVHELNECATANSALYSQGLGNFFLDDMFAFDALIVIPSPEVQDRLVAELNGPDVRTFHEPRYNMLAYPFSTAYQNSNQWALELFAAAMSRDFPIGSREQAQVWLRGAGFQPTTLEIPAMTRLGARMFRANVAFDDQPFDRRMAGLIDVVTVDSMVKFVLRRDPGARTMVLKVAPVPRPRPEMHF